MPLKNKEILSNSAAIVAADTRSGLLLCQLSNRAHKYIHIVSEGGASWLDKGLKQEDRR